MDNKKIKKTRTPKTRLTFNDRLIIEKMLNKGFSIKDIARAVNHHEETIKREIKRGQYEHLNSDLTKEMRYSPDIAHKRYLEKHRKSGAQSKMEERKEFVEKVRKRILALGESPYAACERVKEANPELKTVYYGTIYNYIRAGKLEGLTMKKLPCPQKKTGKGEWLKHNLEQAKEFLLRNDLIESIILKR